MAQNPVDLPSPELRNLQEMAKVRLAMLTFSTCSHSTACSYLVDQISCRQELYLYASRYCGGHSCKLLLVP